MLAIKLQRIGKKHQPSYRFVVAEKRSKMAGPPVEDLGSYNPFTKSAVVNKDRVSYWITKGAQPTTSVHNLFVLQGVLNAPVKPVKMKKASAKPAEAAVEAAPKVEETSVQAPESTPEGATESAPSA